MPSLFPELLVYQLAAPVLVRVGVGVFTLLAVGKILSYWQTSPEKWGRSGPWLFGLPLLGYASMSVFLFLGLFTQMAALVISGLSLFFIAWGSKKQDYFLLSPEFFWLLAITAFSLTLSGPGWWSLDLPV